MSNWKRTKAFLFVDGGMFFSVIVLMLATFCVTLLLTRHDADDAKPQRPAAKSVDQASSR